MLLNLKILAAHPDIAMLVTENAQTKQQKNFIIALELLHKREYAQVDFYLNQKYSLGFDYFIKLAGLYRYFKTGEHPKFSSLANKLYLSPGICRRVFQKYNNFTDIKSGELINCIDQGIRKIIEAYLQELYLAQERKTGRKLGSEKEIALIVNMLDELPGIKSRDLKVALTNILMDMPAVYDKANGHAMHKMRFNYYQELDYKIKALSALDNCIESNIDNKKINDELETKKKLIEDIQAGELLSKQDIEVLNEELEYQQKCFHEKMKSIDKFRKSLYALKS